MLLFRCTLVDVLVGLLIAAINCFPRSCHRLNPEGFVSNSLEVAMNGRLVGSVMALMKVAKHSTI